MIVNPYVVYECPDCRIRLACNDPELSPSCPGCDLPSEALEFVDLAEMVLAESPEHKMLEQARALWLRRAPGGGES